MVVEGEWRGMIRLENIVKTFPGDHGPIEVLKGVSLSVKQGEVFGIIGPSGAGKSTLVRCVNLLERPTGGRVLREGAGLTGLDEVELRATRRRIGMIFQHFNLLSSRTVFGNVAFPLELAGMSKAERERKVDPLLELVGLTDKRDAYPAELSGGQKQRVGIARALASQPAVLLCDEATSALDPETTKSILGLLKDINRDLNLTILLITHEMQVIKEICHRVAVIDDGLIVEEGRVFDVFTDPRTGIARRFVQDVIAVALPREVMEKIVPEGQGGNPLVRIIYTGPSAYLPVLSEISRNFDLRLNILHGQVEYIQGDPFGILTVEVEGSPAEFRRMVEYIQSHHLKVEVLGYVRSDDRAFA